MALTMKDIAQKANVSIATVSRYIHQNGYVSPETQERLKQVLIETDCPYMAPQPLLDLR